MSQLLTLYTTPVVYLFFDRLRMRFSRSKEREHLLNGWEMNELPNNVRWQLWIVAFGFFMQSLDTTIVNTALPSMAQSLGESPLHMHMVIVSYVLTVAVMLPASGWLADKVGVRNIFFTAIVLFTTGSLFCAQASTLDQLVMARVLQGIGGAMMVPVGRLTVMKIVPREQYMAAMTFVTLPGQVGPLLGPALGGILVEYASWHWIFLINLPVGIIGAIATLTLMPNYKMQTRRFDFFGGFIRCWPAGMATLTLALDGQHRAGAFDRPAWRAGDGGRSGDAIVSVARQRQRQRAVQPAAVPHAFVFIGPGRQLRRAHRQRHAAVYDAGVSADWHGLFAVPRRADDDPDGARQHGHEAHCGAGGEPLWLSPRAGGRHAGAGAGQPAVYGRGAAGLVLSAAAGAVLPGDDQLHALLVDEYPDAERPAGRSGQQRQQPAVDDHAALDERRRDRCRFAARHVRPAPPQRRHAGGASGLFVYLSQHGGHYRPARFHLRPRAG